MTVPSAASAPPAVPAPVKPAPRRRAAAKPEPSRTAIVRRARRINRELAELYPDAHCELDFSSPLELLVTTILSAQTTDKRVNQVTPVLFARYRSAADYAAADRDEVEKIIMTTGFFRAKTTSIISLGQALCDRFGGEVPRRLKDLVTLPGVGRKTANVVLGNAFGVPGITVDTHFGRLAARLGWTTETDPGMAHRAGRAGRGDAGPAGAAGPGAGRPRLGGPAAVRGDGGRPRPADRAARAAPAPPRGPAGLPRGRGRALRSGAGGRRAARGGRGGRGGPGGGGGPRGAARAVHPAQRLPGHPRAGLVACAKPAGGRRGRGDRVGGPGPADRPRRPGQPAERAASLRRRGPGLPRARHADLGLHRAARGPAARARRVGAALGHRPRGGPPPRRARRRRAQLAGRRCPAAAAR